MKPLKTSKRLAILCGLSLFLNAAFAGIPSPSQEGKRTPVPLPPPPPPQEETEEFKVYQSPEEAMKAFERMLEDPTEMERAQRMTPEEAQRAFQRGLEKAFARIREQRPELFRNPDLPSGRGSLKQLPQLRPVRPQLRKLQPRQLKVRAILGGEGPKKLRARVLRERKPR